MNENELWLLNATLALSKVENNNKKASLSFLFKYYETKDKLRPKISYREIEKLVDGENLVQIANTIKLLKEENLIDTKDNSIFLNKELELSHECKRWLFDTLKIFKNNTRGANAKIRILYTLANFSKNCKLLIKNEIIQKASKVSYMTLYTTLNLLKDNNAIEIKDDIIILKNRKKND